MTMAAGYFDSGKAAQSATFELFFRRLPRYRNYVVSAGLAQVVEYLLNLRFTEDDVAYLRRVAAIQARVGGVFRLLTHVSFYRRSVRALRKALRSLRGSHS